VRNWLAVAASVPGFIGFAVGRTTFWDPLVAWRSKKATREQTVAEIAGRYREFVNLFERADLHPPPDRSSRGRPEHRSSMES
jgi:myo-inositol catabolism protein IolC